MLMRHDQFGDSARLSADPRALDAFAQAADPRHAFLRHAWYAGDGLRVLSARRADGSPIAAFPLRMRKVGPFSMSEVAGSYWPFRSLPVGVDAGEDELTALLRRRDVRHHLGPIWRLGPVFENDDAAARLAASAEAAGWTVLRRRLGTSFEIDIARLLAEGPWPRGSSMKKNRWREKKLAEIGTLETVRFTGADWTAELRDAVAAIERGSWLAGEDRAGLQFANPAQRHTWERAADDPLIAQVLFGAILFVGGVPAAFTFGLDVGTTRYQIANNYDERFAALSAGRTLLVSEFERAARNGIAKISWGSGDAGYKSEMGATAGAEIHDLLFVRSRPLAWTLRHFWKDAL